MSTAQITHNIRILMPNTVISINIAWVEPWLVKSGHSLQCIISRSDEFFRRRQPVWLAAKLVGIILRWTTFFTGKGRERVLFDATDHRCTGHWSRFDASLVVVKVGGIAIHGHVLDTFENFPYLQRLYYLLFTTFSNIHDVVTISLLLHLELLLSLWLLWNFKSILNPTSSGCVRSWSSSWWFIAVLSNVQPGGVVALIWMISGCLLYGELVFIFRDGPLVLS